MSVVNIHKLPNKPKLIITKMKLSVLIHYCLNYVPKHKKKIISKKGKGQDNG